MYQIYFYVPVKDKEKVKKAMFEAGAGRIGNYENCSFESTGIGQFKPLAGSKPSLGAINELSTVEEVKVEMICEPQVIEKVIQAFKKEHPYEEPAYGYLELFS